MCERLDSYARERLLLVTGNEDSDHGFRMAEPSQEEVSQGRVGEQTSME